MGYFLSAFLFIMNAFCKLAAFILFRITSFLSEGNLDVQTISCYLVSTVLNASYLLFLFGIVVFIIAYYWNDKLDFLKSLDNPTTPELETMSPLQVTLFYCLLTRRTSRYMGRLMDMKIPYHFRRPLYSCACKALKINVNEFEGQFEDYQSPGCFFTRTLKSNVRKVFHHPFVLVSPCDGTVSYMDSNIATAPNLQVHQVKGVRYLLSDFLGESPSCRSSNRLYSH